MRDKNAKGISVEEDDLVSVYSGESTATMSGPMGPQLERKINAKELSIDVQLNQFLLKW